MKYPKLLIAIFLCYSVCTISCSEEDDILLPAEVEVLLNEMVDVMEANSINRDKIDWVAFKREVLDTARQAPPRSQRNTGIRKALTLLGDNHSYFINSSGSYLWKFNPLNCDSETNFSQTIPNDVGYVRVTGFHGDGEEAITFAQLIQDEIKKMDSKPIQGWIVDLRKNSGGNMYPMLVGIGPILGDGTAGFFKKADGSTSPYGYRSGAALHNGGTVMRIENSYEVKQSDLKVAVLFDHAIGSSGEAMALAFTGRPKTRTFGTPTCGLSTGIQGIRLRDGSTLGLATTIMTDRNLQHFNGGPVVPDEEADVTNIINKAADWIRSE